MNQIGALTQINIAKRCVAVVAWAAEHKVFTIDLSRKQYTVTIERQQRIFKKSEFFKIKCISNPNGWTVIAVAPSDIITVFEPEHTRIVAILKMAKLQVMVFPFNRIVIKLPLNSIVAETAMHIHVAFLIIAAEDACKFSFERHDGTVENAVR